MDSAFNSALNMFKNTLGGVGNFVNKEVQQFSPAVGNFAQQATQSLLPQVNPIAQTQQEVQGIGNLLQSAAKPVQQFFNPESNGGQNFWSTPVAGALGAVQQGQESLAQHPFNVADQVQPTVANALGGGPGAQTAGFIAGLPGEAIQGIANVPQQIAKAGTDIGTDIRTNDWTMQKAIGDLAEAAMPILTVATLGSGGAIEQLGKEGLADSLAKGTLSGMKMGGEFGLLGGLGSNRDTTDMGQYISNVFDSTAQGVAAGGLLGMGIAGGSKIRMKNPVEQAIETSNNPNATLPDSSITHQQFAQNGADLLSPPGQSAIMDQVRNATTNQPSFHDMLDTTAQQVNGRAISNVKHPLTAAEKIVDHRIDGDQSYGVNDVNDYLRGAVVINDRTQLPGAVQSIENNLQQRGYKILNTDDYFKKPGAQNYEGYHIDAQMPSGQRAEVQLHTNQSWANARLTHSVYAKYNEDVPDQMKSELDDVQKQIKSASPQQVDVAARADEAYKKLTGKFINPIETDHTGNYTDQALAQQGLNDYFAKGGMLDTTEAKSDTQLGMDMLNNQRLAGETSSQQAPKFTLQQPNEMVQSLIEQRNAASQDLQDAQSQLTRIQNGQVQGKTMSPKEVQRQIKGLQNNINTLNQQIATEQKGAQVTQQQNVAQQGIKINQDRQQTNKVSAQAQQTGNYAPKEGFTPSMGSIASELNRPYSDDFNVNDGRAFAQRVEGNEGANQNLITRSVKQLSQEFKGLTDDQKSQVQLSLSEPSLAVGFTPEQTALKNQLQGIYRLSSKVRGDNDPKFQALQDYGPIQVKGASDNIDPNLKLAVKTALSTFSPENLHRQIQGFIPADGTGDRLVGSPGKFGSASGLKQVGSTYEDTNGKQYLPVTATQREYSSLGINAETDPIKALQGNLQSTLRLKNNSSALDSLNGDQWQGKISDYKVKGFKQVDVPGLRNKWVDPKLADAIGSLGGNNKSTNPILNAVDVLQSGIRQTILTNPIVHPANMYINSLIGSAEAGPGGVLNLHKNIVESLNDVATKNDNYLAAQRQGIGLGGFSNKQGPGIFQRVMDNVFNDNTLASKIGETADTLNPVRQALRANKATVGFVDDALRTAIYRTYLDRGLDSAKAQSETQHFMVDYGNTNEFEKNVVSRAMIFYPWLKGNLGILGRPIGNLATGQAGAASKDVMPLMMGAVLYGGLTAAQSYIQQQTGNQDARLRFPGSLGLARDFVEAPGQIANKEIPQGIVSHIQPMIRAGAQQATNTTRLNDVLKPGASQIVTNKITPDQANMARINNLAGATIGPYTMASGIDQGKKTGAEVGANYLGLTTPHLKGFSAVPNQRSPLSVLNAPGSKPTTGMEIIHGKDAGTKNWSQDDFNNLQKVQELSGTDRYKAFADNPNFYNKYAAMKKAEAQATGQTLDPIYNYNGQDMKLYSQWKQEQAGGKGGLTAYENPKVIQIQRGQNDYLARPDVQAQNKATAEAQGKTYSPHIPDPMYQQANNSQIADYEKWTSLPQGAEKSAWAANHPWTKDISVMREPYQLQQLQAQWNSRPAGQSQNDFLKQHQNANFAGVDDSGNIIPLRNPTDNPWLQLNKDQKQVVLSYSAERSASGATDVKTKTLLSTNSWLPAYWNAEKLYYGSSKNTGDSTGLGLTFGGSNTGTGTSSTSYAQNSMDNAFRRQLLYASFRDAAGHTPPMTFNLPAAATKQTPLNLALDKLAQQAVLKPVTGMPTTGGPTQQDRTTVAMPKLSKPQRTAIRMQGIGGISSFRQ